MTGQFKVIFLSGAEGSGRKLASAVIGKEGATGPYLMDLFQFESRERCHASFKIMENQTRHPAPGYAFEHQIDVPLKCFEGMTPKQAYRAFRENFVFPCCGEDAEGRWLVERIEFFRDQQRKKRSEDKWVKAVVVPDLESAACAQVLIDKYGIENCTHIHVVRQGTEDAPMTPALGVETRVVENPGDTVSGLANAVRYAVPHLFIYLATELPE